MEREDRVKQPKVIFADAVGTLFGVRGNVGEVYGAIAARFGVSASSDTLNKAFYQAFAASEPLVFPGSTPEEIPDCEFEWWQTIALRTFHQAGVLNQFSDFYAFFEELYAHFATAEPWFVYPDVLMALENWQSRGIQLGVVSNFDSRIYSVLKALDLAEFFTSVTICSEVGAAKPDPQIFAAALQKHSCEPTEAWHIGDSYKEDYEGAKAAGVRGIWLKRNS
jgi:putative hydrolase of the HAD superfamily